MENVDLVKKVVIEAVQLGKVIDKQLEDGFQLTDALSIVMEGKDLAFVVKDWKAIKLQLKDLDPTEVKELVESLVAELGISDAEIAVLIEKVINFAEAGYDLFVAIKDLKN